MTDQATKAKQFAQLHSKGDPVIIYNAWDGGTAKAIASCGAKAIVTGDHPVAFAHGYDDSDFDDFSFEAYLNTAKEIMQRIGDLPFSMDISNGEGLSPEALAEKVKTVISAGVVGINFEDLLADGSGIRPMEDQVSRLQTIRAAADETGIPLFINARTDLFSTTNANNHADLLDEAVARAKAYENAGANGFFVPKLIDISLIQQLCSRIELPINIIRIPNAPSTTDLAQAGVGRISYGPIPQVEMIEWVKQKATAALTGQV